MDRFSTCVKILSALQAMKEVDLEPEQRLLHLETIRAFIGDVILSMENIYLDCSFPMTSKEKASIELLTWINVEIAGNYQRVGMATDNVELSADSKVFALNQALKHLGHSLLYIAQAYQVAFTGLWQACYQIYKVAEQNQLLDIEIKRGSGEGTQTINKTFKQILLFSLSDINQYRPRDMDKIYDMLGKFSYISEIMLYGPDEPQKECFFGSMKN